MPPSLPIPRFHHVHLNAVDPEASIGFYTRQFDNTAKTTWGGMPAVATPNDVLLLFDKVEKAPPIEPQSAIWHFGWHVTDVRRKLAAYQARPEGKLVPLYTEPGRDDYVLINSDTWAGEGAVLGRTRAQLAAARAQGLKPPGGAGFAYLEAPDGTLIEYMGDYPVERFNHVHLYQEQPFCAQLWYQKHFNAPPMAGRESPQPISESTCRVPRGSDRTWPALAREGMLREPRAAVMFGDVMLTWYAPQGDAPLAPSRGQRYDHLAFAVADLDAWTAKLKDEGVTFLRDTYRLGNTRAVMVEGPSREALELVEA